MSTPFRKPPPARVIVLLGRCLLLVLLCQALTACSRQTVDAPRLVLPDTPLRLGEAAAGETLSGVVPITNAGNRMLRITRLEAGCGCASLRLSDDEIAPGGQALVQVTVSITEEGQRLQFPVRLFSNDPVSPLTVYTVEAAAAPPVLRTGPARLDFGEIPVGGSPAKRLALLKPDGSPWPADEGVTVEAPPDLAHVRTVKQVREGAPDSLAVEVRPRDNLTRGHFQGNLTIRPAGSQRAVTVAVSGQVVPKILVSPTSVYFGDVDPKSGPMKRNVLLRRMDGRPWSRVVKTTAPEALEVTEAETAGAAAAPEKPKRLQVTLNPAKTTQDLKDGKVLVWLEGEPEPLTIRVLVFLARTSAPPE